ncbi:hypothetical protein HLK66_26105 (plasmid) [Niallia circulans]|uniref:hypothetical protein n=1 Tax=Niallia circulans TaxID=1397 RepID=UPI000FBD3E9B|nr:hypothetical protein [Niallia circulans]QJX65155.1 hypothetical protein HLK66_26105 [Niallia circulans]
MDKSLVITILLGCLLYTCTSSDIKNEKYKEKATFIGTIEEITDNIGLVDIEEGEILSSVSNVAVISRLTLKQHLKWETK